MPTHSGFYSTTISGTVVNGDNVNYGTLPGAYGELTVPGNFAIANGNGYPLVQIQAGTIVSPLGTLNIGYSNPNITIDFAGGAPATNFIVQDFLAPGTNPVVPTAGAVTINGSLVAAQSIPVQSISLAASSLDIQLQVTSASAVSDFTQNGLAHFDSSMFTVDANGFVQLAGGSIAADEFLVQAGTSPVVPNGSGQVTVTASAVAATAIPAQTFGTGANSYDVQIQRADDFGVSSAANAGLASFNSAQFSVDANGWVSLAGGGLAIDQIQVDAATAPGVNPVDPDATGLVTITGGQIAAASTANVIRSHSTALNSLTIEVQRTSQSPVSSAALNGVAHFDSAHFTVDPNGFVSNLNGVSASAFDVQAFTAPGTDPVLPNASGVVQVNGTIVAAHLIPLQTNSLAANTYNIEAQYASAQAVDTPAASGMCHFDSSQFTVSATGFVQVTATGGITWQDFAPGALSISNGYFATGAGAYTLPLGVADGETVEIIDNIGGGVVVTAAGAQTIRVQNVNSSAGGTCTSTQFGDALRLIFRASIGEWQCCPGGGGNWLLA